MAIFCKNNKILVESITPTPDFAEKHPAWIRLENQLEWYDHKSQICQSWYKWLKLVQVALAVLIPVTSLLPNDHAKWVSSIAGALIALLEGIQQINQYSTLWVTYRSTAERLKHEKYLFLSAAGSYRDSSESERLIQLAERIEELVSTEHANWINDSRRAAYPAESEKK